VPVVNESIGLAIVFGGAILFAIELLHPGALLIIPATIMIVAGILYLLVPDVLLDSLLGPVVVMIAAIIATIGTIQYYRWLAGTHTPLSTTSRGLVGEEGVIIADVVPNTMRGKVRIRSEVWSVRGATPIPAGTRVKVVSGEGVSVTVEPIDATPAPPPS
jgi:membrane protein implicated in regulation of membrane protease activity